MNEDDLTKPNDDYYFGGLIKIDLSELEAVASTDPMFIEKGPPQ